MAEVQMCSRAKRHGGKRFESKHNEDSTRNGKSPNCKVQPLNEKQSMAFLNTE